MSANGVVSNFHQLTAFTVTLLAALLPLRYQKQTPLAILPTTVLVAVSSIILYFLLYILLLLAPTTSRFSPLAHHLLVLSAYLAVCSLAAAVLPGGAAPFLYTIFALFFAGNVMHVFCEYLVVYRRRVGGFLKDRWSGFRGFLKKIWSGVGCFVTEDEDGEEDDEEASKFRAYCRRVRGFLKNMCSGRRRRPPSRLPV